MRRRYDSHPQVAEVVKDDPFEIAREHEKVEDLVRGEKVASFL